MAGDDLSPGDHGQADATDGSASQPASKKRKTGPSTRGVANLTPEQLARKRANDREAQRAIRERTKNQIDALNRRIQDLESQQPYHDLQLVLRDKEVIEAELHDTRKRLESIISIASPALRAPGGPHYPPGGPHVIHGPGPSHILNGVNGVNGLTELAAAATRSPLAAPPRPLNTNFNPTLDHAPSPQNGLHSPAVTDGARPWALAGDTSSQARRWSNEGPHLHHDRSHEMPFDERMGVDFLLENNGQSRALDPNLPQSEPPPTITTNRLGSGSGHHAPIMVPYLTLPRNVPTTCPLDAILIDFLTERQQQAASGTPIKTLVGPLYPNFTPIVIPDRNVDAHPLSKLFTDILRTFPDICGLPEQVATVYIMFLVMRWMIEPTAENYDRLPCWITPRPSQLFVPHAIWVDHVPWPKLRDRLITSHQPVAFDTFFIPFTTTISLNWPYEGKDCLIPASKLRTSTLSTTSSIPASSPFSTAVNAGSPTGPPTPQTSNTPGSKLGVLPKEDDEWLINPAFESHLRNLGNWSVGPAFRSAFPSFSDAVRIKDSR